MLEQHVLPFAVTARVERCHPTDVRDMLVTAGEFLACAIDEHARIGAQRPEGEVAKFVARHRAGAVGHALEDIVAGLGAVRAIDLDMIGGKMALPEGEVLLLPCRPALPFAVDELRFNCCRLGDRGCGESEGKCGTDRTYANAISPFRQDAYCKASSRKKARFD